MGLNATTFILEIVNFLVLLWLLSHFLYRPVQAAIAKRQQQAEQASHALADERAAVQAQQEALRQARAGFDVEREAARQKLSADIAAERKRRLAALDAELEDERAKARARMAAQRGEDARRQDAEATQRVQERLRDYLGRLAGPELEQAITRLFLADLAGLTPDALHTLRAAPASAALEIATSFEPTDEQRRSVEAALTQALGPQPPAQWRIDPALIAGISVRLDGHLLEASLARALDAFVPTTEAGT
jgi:F-type H+-transporting ATPase subunit b